MLKTHNMVRQGRARDERGTALAELAIVMPLLLVLIACLGLANIKIAMNFHKSTLENGRIKLEHGKLNLISHFELLQ